MISLGINKLLKILPLSSAQKASYNLSMVENRDSFISMWRALVALTGVDGIVSQEESDFIGNAINNKRLFSDEERNLLFMDMQSPQDPMPLIDKITSPGHISQIHHLANLLFHADGMDAKEKKYLDEIKAHIESRINIMQGTRKAQDHMSKVEKEKEKSLSTVRGILDNFIKKFL